MPRKTTAWTIFTTLLLSLIEKNNYFFMQGDVC